MTGLHHTWTDQWASDLKEPNLRASLLDHARFASRIEEDMLSEFFDTSSKSDDLANTANQVDELASQFDEALLLNAGLYWSSPALPFSLTPLTGLPDVAPTRARLQMILAGRGHSAAALVSVPINAEDIQSEGEACLDVWIRCQPGDLPSRLRLRRHAGAPVSPPSPQADRVRFLAIQTAFSVAAKTME